MRVGLVLVVTLTLLGGCGDSSESPAATADGSDPDEPGDARFPDVVAASAERTPDGSFRFDVTVSSPYDSPERYADAWRVVAPDGTVLAVRELAHDHATEQPFTRSLSGVEIPDGVAVVTVQGRDSANGWGGEVTELVIDGG